jgi:hypothetical protein
MENFLFSDDDIRKVLNKNNKTIDEFIDNNKKEIGDRVVVIDYSSMSHIDCEFEYDDYERLADLKPDDFYVVCYTGQKNVLKKSYTSTPVYKQDLIIADPKTKTLFKISSKHVRLL